MAAKGNTYILARWTHQAAREGTVPLCEDDIWNPKETLESPHSGLNRQPTKEWPVSRIPGLSASASSLNVTALKALALLAVSREYLFKFCQESVVLTISKH